MYAWLVRLLTILVLTALLAWGLWTLLRVRDEPPPPPEDPVRKAREADAVAAGARAGLTTGTLVVRVQTPAGEVPPRTRAGYLYAGEPHLKPVGPNGEARFTDAPLGTLTVLARAPGFPEVTQQCAVLAGIRADAVLTLRAEAAEGPR